jgi:hypothetical protein
LLFQGYLLQFLQLKDLDVKKQWLYSSWYTLFVAVSLWFVQKSNNVNELRTVIIVIVYIFRRIFLTVMLFLARGIIAGVFQAAYVYTPEVYPTSLRAVGVGSCSAMARLGAMVTPYVAQVCHISHIKCVDFSLCEWIFCLINYCKHSYIH